MSKQTMNTKTDNEHKNILPKEISVHMNSNNLASVLHKQELF